MNTRLYWWRVVVLMIGLPCCRQPVTAADFVCVARHALPDVRVEINADAAGRIRCTPRSQEGNIVIAAGDLVHGFVVTTRTPTSITAARIFIDCQGRVWRDRQAYTSVRRQIPLLAPAPPFPDALFLVRACDQFGNLWALTCRRGDTSCTGVAVLPADAPERWVTVEKNLPADPLLDLACDERGYAWVAGDAGVFCFDPRNPDMGWRVIPHTAEYPAGAATALGISATGQALAAPAHGGLFELELLPDGQLRTRQIISATLPAAPIRGIYTDARGNLWVVAGGSIYQREVEAEAWQRRWSPLARIPYGNHDIFAAVAGGKVYVPGGVAAHGFPARFSYFDRMTVFDPRANRWSLTAPMSVRRCYSGVATLDDRIWVIGGGIQPADTRVPTDLVEIYDPATARWTPGPSLPSARMESVVITAADRIYVLGGTGADDNGAGVVSIGRGETAWRAEPPAPLPLAQCAGCVLDGIIYIATNANRGLLAFNPATGAWRRDLAPITCPRMPRAALVTAHRGEVWVMGGRDTDTPTACWRYNPVADRWSAGPILPRPISWGAAVQIDDRLLILGGASQDAAHKCYLFSDAVYALREEER